MPRHLTWLFFLSLTGCTASNFEYLRPVTVTPPSNSIVVNRPVDSLWSAAVPALSREFFVINNIDKASGLINVSYSGDPEKYIDCGRIVSYVKNLRGARTYDFPASRASAQYETMTGLSLYAVERRMSLEGRINVVFEAVGSDQTRVTVNTRYVLSRALTIRDALGKTDSRQESISFDSKHGASFAVLGTAPTTECSPNGRLEQSILDLMK